MDQVFLFTIGISSRWLADSIERIALIPLSDFNLIFQPK